MWPFSRHLSEGEIRAFADGELPSLSRERAESHLSGCPSCTRRLDDARRREALFRQGLVAPQHPTNISVARLRFESYRINKENDTMSRKNPQRLRLAAALVLVAAIAVAFAFPQVRAAASNFLSLFRVEKIALIPFDPNNIALQNSGNELSDFFDQNAKIEEVGEEQVVGSVEEAEALAGIPVRLPTATGLGELTLTVAPGVHGEMDVDLPRLRALISEAGLTDIDLPENLDNAHVVADVPRAVMAEWGDCQVQMGHDPNDPDDQPRNSGRPNCVTLAQVASPTVTSTPDLDFRQLGQAFLQLTGMPEADAVAFSERIDWATTLVVPIPMNQDIDYEEVDVDGVSGALIRNRYDSSRGGYTLFWVKDGILYVLTGMDGSYAGRRIADTME